MSVQNLEEYTFSIFWVTPPSEYWLFCACENCLFAIENIDFFQCEYFNVIASVNLLTLNSELCCRPGIIFTDCAGSLTLWMSVAHSEACETCPNSVWNVFVKGIPIQIKGTLTLPQVGTAPESATMDCILPFRTSCLILFLSFPFHFLLYAVSLVHFVCCPFGCDISLVGAWYIGYSDSNPN